MIELAPGMDLRHVWHEVSLLRACVHRRLVALLGVVCQVGVRRLLGLPTVLPARCRYMCHCYAAPVHGLSCHSPTSMPLQGQLLMLVMELMRGGDLHSALQQPATRDALRWAARWAGDEWMGAGGRACEIDTSAVHPSACVQLATGLRAQRRPTAQPPNHPRMHPPPPGAGKWRWMWWRRWPSCTAAACSTQT